MMNVPLDCDFDVPKWDVALEALMREEYDTIGPLTLADVERLSSHFSIRFDDMVTTLFELVLLKQWYYQDRQGKLQSISDSEIDRLFSKGRISKKDLVHFDGFWSPEKPDTE